MNRRDAHLDPQIGQSLATMLIGDYLGSGIHRSVFKHASDPTKVVKIERMDAADPHFANMKEWEIWDHLKHSAHGKVLAPCHQISCDGRILIQSRAVPLNKNDRKKVKSMKVPSAAWDVHGNNVGWIDGKLVIFDYGLFNITKDMKWVTKRFHSGTWRTSE